MGVPPSQTILGRLDRELWLLTAASGGRRGGLIATSVSSVSIIPEHPRVLVALAKSHHTWALVEQSGAFALHLLDEARLDWVWRFGLQSGRDVDKLEGLAVHPGVSGSPILKDLPGGWLDCRVVGRLDTGDRTVFLGDVIDDGPGDGLPPLTARRMLELAPEARRRELAEQMERDIDADRRALEAWRQQGGEP